MTKPRPLFLLIAMLFAGAGCASTSSSEIGSETNWLRQCSANADCDSAGSCVCGICSQRCMGGDGCGSGLMCQPHDSALVRDACGDDSPTGLCAPRCEHNSECASKRCVDGACTAAAQRAQPGAIDVRVPDAFVIAGLAPDSSCVYTEDNPIMAIGLYDIAPNGARSDGSSCAHGYRLRLKISNDEPGVLQLSGARVELMTIDHETLVFELDGGSQPNPFTFESSQTISGAVDGKPKTAIFEVEAIRAAQAPMLADYDKKQILAQITVLGTDADDKPIAFRPFLYPIDICDRCLTMCASRLTPEQTREDFAMGQCDDNAGADGRLCFDPDC